MICTQTNARRFCVVGAVGIMLALSLCATSYSDAPSTAPATAPVVLDFTPISYFQDNCARCHGSYGRTYTPGMAGRYTDAALHDKVEMMANGPAQAPLEAAQLDEIVAYQISLNQGKPFVSLQSLKKGDTGAWEVAGEVTPKAKVMVTAGAARAEAAVDGHAWTSTLPGSAGPGQVSISATVGASSIQQTAVLPGAGVK